MLTAAAAGGLSLPTRSHAADHDGTNDDRKHGQNRNGSPILL
jgi:hypothetical protein